MQISLSQVSFWNEKNAKRRVGFRMKIFYACGYSNVRRWNWCTNVTRARKNNVGKSEKRMESFVSKSCFMQWIVGILWIVLSLCIYSFLWIFYYMRAFFGFFINNFVVGSAVVGTVKYRKPIPLSKIEPFICSEIVFFWLEIWDSCEFYAISRYFSVNFELFANSIFSTLLGKNIPLYLEGIVLSNLVNSYY